MKICGNTSCDCFNPEFDGFCDSALVDLDNDCSDCEPIDLQLPKILFLQIQDDDGNIRDIVDATWCSERIHDTDIKYNLM